ncbi:MAG: hypothetical protein AAFP26_01000 [Planctomycetota bacterium]
MSINDANRDSAALKKRLESYAVLAAAAVPVAAAGGDVIVGGPVFVNGFESVDLGGVATATFQASTRSGNVSRSSFTSFFTSSPGLFFYSRASGYRYSNNSNVASAQLRQINGGDFSILTNYGDAARLSQGFAISDNAAGNWLQTQSFGLGTFRSYNSFRSSSYRLFSTTNGVTNIDTSRFTSDGFGVVQSYGAFFENPGLLGFRFSNGDGTFTYGWLDLQVVQFSGLEINGWGISDTANEGVLAGTDQAVPAPGALTLLAMGAAGIRRTRRRVG